ncbi:hypothetical protein V6M85_02325 [Sulfolobus tengchongensis]|uniref:Uncharacterized protein n=1 Tax=Sulfolobus tengchongensis TaxID=207809 RepID=A0AAX4L217_9CREN
MNYKNYPISLGITYSVLSSIFAALNVTDLRIYVLTFAILSVMIEIIYYPFPRKFGYIASAISGFWVIWSIYYVLQIFGVV